ncbi:MAG TPA: glycoside hydrolase family 3 N-terminal domain-containing protein [Ilumatobacter sp.]|nr:glycoside hydrolase family 3 N-terminal domain-containing protein [Ilumatobacter sp.]
MARNRAALAVPAVGVSVTVIVLAALIAWWTIGDDDSAKKTSARRDPSANGSERSGPQPAATSPPCDPQAVIASWPLEQRLAQLLMVGVDAQGDDAEALVAQYGVGGVFVGGQETGIFVDGSLARLATVGPVPPLVAVDEEGGRVQRIDQLAGPIPSARAMAQTMTPAQVRELAAQRGRTLREAGITMDLAPVVDVSSQSSSQVIGDRSFSDDPVVVSEYAGAFAAGLRDAGVVPVLKHFPGHGHATGDSHRQAVVTPPMADLEVSDLIPYRNLLAAPPIGVMTGHLDVPGLTAPDEPASVSANAVRELLRTELGYDGFVITDDLSAMAAVRQRYSVPEATLRALAAGSDMALLVSNAQVPDLLGFLAGAVATHQLDETQINRSVQRVLAVKAFDPCRIGV